MKYIFSTKYKWEIAAVMVFTRPPRGVFTASYNPTMCLPTWA